MSNKTIIKTKEYRTEYEAAIRDMLDQKMNLESFNVDNEQSDAFTSLIKDIDTHIEVIRDYIAKIPRVAKLREKDNDVVSAIIEDQGEFISANFELSSRIVTAITDYVSEHNLDVGNTEAVELVNILKEELK